MGKETMESWHGETATRARVQRRTLFTSDVNAHWRLGKAGSEGGGQSSEETRLPAVWLGNCSLSLLAVTGWGNVLCNWEGSERRDL